MCLLNSTISQVLTIFFLSNSIQFNLWPHLSLPFEPLFCCHSNIFMFLNNVNILFFCSCLTCNIYTFLTFCLIIHLLTLIITSHILKLLTFGGGIALSNSFNGCWRAAASFDGNYLKTLPTFLWHFFVLFSSPTVGVWAI